MKDRTPFFIVLGIWLTITLILAGLIVYLAAA